MGKNLIQQARGKGSPTYRAPSFKYKGSIKYPKITTPTVGKIIDIVHCRGHSAPLLSVKFDNGQKLLSLAPEGVRVGDSVQVADNAEIKAGNVTQLSNIPEGTLIYNVESQPGDGGKYCRSSGTFAKIVARLPDRVIITLSSKKERNFNPKCRATIGIVAGGGRPEKPFVKAGTKYHKMRAKNKLFPKVSGVSQNAVDHPFGGTQSSHKGKPTTVPKHAPPGRKVGLLRARRTGKRKK